ncbi:MAG: tetratricopeptide repeat protein [Muribaculaceae bacterium]|nr:tetratricopeptide repeat protein [Muribaculaceae bacterium]
MKRIKLHWILPMLLAMTMLLPMVVAGRERGGISEADQRKASYIFLEAQNWKSREVNDAYFDLLRWAYELDTTNTSAAFYLGHALLTMRGADSNQRERALALLKKHFDAHPDDYYETTFYSDACMMLGYPEQGLEAVKTLCRNNPGKLEVQARLADAYTRLGEYDKANAALDTIELHYGHAFSLTSKKISNFIEMNDTAAAIAEMRRLLDTAPGNAQYNLGMAGVMQQFEMNDSALHYINAAQQAEPNNGYTYLAKAQFYQEIGDSAACDQQMELALITENLELDDKLGLLSGYIRERMGSGDTTQRVAKLFDILFEQHPHEADIHKMYSDYLRASGDLKGAVEQLGYVLDIEPTDATIWRALIVLHILDDNNSAALQAAERALEFNPDNLDLYEYLGPIYYQTKEYDKALETYHRALAMTDSTDVERRSELIGGMGDVFIEQGDTLKAFDTYEQALALNPLNAGALNNYAYFLSLCGRDLDKAERMASTAVMLYSHSATYIDTYAWVLFKKGDLARALEQIRAAIEADDEPNAEMLDHYGDILEANGQHDQAREQWRRALDLEPGNNKLKEKLK